MKSITEATNVKFSGKRDAGKKIKAYSVEMLTAGLETKTAIKDE
jgi:hypothetical protein